MNLIQDQIFSVKGQRFQVKEIWMSSMTKVDYYTIVSLSGGGAWKMTHTEIQEKYSQFESWTLPPLKK